MKLALVLCSDMHMDIERANRLIECSKHEWVFDYTLADIIIIMTCAFGTKKNYSMYVIADVMQNAKEGSRIIATGCLTKINANELKAIPNLEVKSFEEVMHMIGTTSDSLEKPKICKIHQNKVIISNGCLKNCSYCVYPLIEGKYASKPKEEIFSEVYELSKYESTIYITGAHETSDYGVDLYGRRTFAELMDSICTKFPNCNYIIGWFHPIGLTDDVINVIAKHKNIVQIMVHIQHTDNEILKNMHRPSFEYTNDRIQKLHSKRPDLSISTELIVGFPGETEEKFENLVNYLEANRTVFNDLGVASYEAVLNTKAAQLANLPDYSIRNKRMEFIKKQFGATCYMAPPDFKPILSSYFEANFLLSKIPSMCIEATERQVLPYIAGTDTDFKINFIVNFQEFTMEMLRDMVCNKKYTSDFRNWLLQIVDSQKS